MSDHAYMGSPWYVRVKNKTEDLVENLGENKIFKNAECKDNFIVEKLGCKNSIN